MTIEAQKKAKRAESAAARLEEELAAKEAALIAKQNSAEKHKKNRDRAEQMLE